MKTAEHMQKSLLRLTAVETLFNLDFNCDVVYLFLQPWQLQCGRNWGHELTITCSQPIMADFAELFFQHICLYLQTNYPMKLAFPSKLEQQEAPPEQFSSQHPLSHMAVRQGSTTCNPNHTLPSKKTPSWIIRGTPEAQLPGSYQRERCSSQMYRSLQFLFSAREPPLRDQAL